MSFRWPRKLLWLTVALLVGLIAAVTLWWNWRGSRTNPSQIAGPVGLTRPVEPGGEYVGSQRCVECHQEIADQYFATQPMGRSLAAVPDAPTVEDWSHSEFKTEGGRVYRVERKDGEVVHHEILKDIRGQTIYDQGVPVHFALGSGERGRSYLILRNGMIFQSPISWYSQKNKWALAPGYPPASHERFESRVTEDCLFCHSGRTLPVKSGTDRFRENVFAEAHIGCERCHGPGQDHVAFQQGDSTAKDSIVNPADLEPARRDAVCYQCHFRARHSSLRYGRSPEDFRPGERYEQTWVALVEPLPESGPSNAHTIVEQFESSRCFRQSQENLSCTTCHDPHNRPPAAERIAFYRTRCLQCHNEQSCTLPVARQQAAPAEGSCVYCHMPRLATDDVPHTALTDHRILKNPKPTSAETVDPRSLVFFKQSEQNLNDREKQRARGIVFAHTAIRNNERTLAAEAARLLNPQESFDPQGTWLTSLGDDIDALNELGLSLVLGGDAQRAQACWQRILELAPDHEAALNSLMMISEQQQQWPAALAYAERSLKLNPFKSSTHWTKTLTLARLGRTEEAIEAAQLLLEQDPSAWFVRAWLVKTYRSLGRENESQQQRAILTRWPRSSSGPPPAVLRSLE